MCFAISVVFSCVIILINFSVLESCRNCCLFAKTIFSILFLICSYVGHSIKKCTSSSTDFGQKGQNLISLGVLGVLCRPFSISKKWLDSLNFVIDCRAVVFFIVWRYSSQPISVLSNEYVRSLLSGLLIV